MTKLVGLSGSLRRGSYNTALLEAARALTPDGVSLEIATIAGIPVYNGDDEARDGIPPAVSALKDLIAAADGLLLASPEYNNSLPGPLKNAIDWCTRPPNDAARVFGGKPVALMGASPGGFGTTLGQIAWLPVLRTLNTRPWFGERMLVSRAHEAFDEDGALTDQGLEDRLRTFIEGFAEFVAAA